VCIGGEKGHCAIFQPPQEIEDASAEFNQRMYSTLFAPIPFFSPPLKYILHGVREKSIAIPDAFDIVVSSNYHSKSIQEWASAHLIVMAAVKPGHRLRSPEYRGDVRFWWNHLYKMASLIEMGEQDRHLVLKFIIEAEKAGILGEGCAEMFRETTKIDAVRDDPGTEKSGLLVAMEILDALAKSGIPEESKHDLLQKARKFLKG